MARSTELRTVVKNRFYPFAEQQGFTRAKSSSSLFIVFRRHGAATTHVFDIQWDKYHEPRFVLNFGEMPAEGARWGDEHVTAEAAESFQCPLSGRLQRRRGGSLGCWFQLRKPFFTALKSGVAHYTPDEVVDQVIDAFRELEEWWRSKAAGPHIHR